MIIDYGISDIKDILINTGIDNLKCYLNYHGNKCYSKETLLKLIDALLYVFIEKNDDNIIKTLTDKLYDIAQIEYR